MERAARSHVRRIPRSTKHFAWSHRGRFGAALTASGLTGPGCSVAFLSDLPLRRTAFQIAVRNWATLADRMKNNDQRRRIMPGEVTADYVRARWAYSELLSWGHGHLYQGPGVQDLKEKLAQRVPFDELGKAEHYLLIDQFDRVRGKYFNRYIIGIPHFNPVLWSKDELAAVYVLPYFVRDVS